MAVSKPRRALHSWVGSGDPWIWLNACAIGISICAVVGVIGLITTKALGHFWPSEVNQIDYQEDGQSKQVFGVLVEQDFISRQRFVESGNDESLLRDNANVVSRWLIKTGNRRTAAPDFRRLYDHQILRLTTPPHLVVLQRSELGDAYGIPAAIRQNGVTLTATATAEQILSLLDQQVVRHAAIRAELAQMQNHAIAQTLREIESARDTIMLATTKTWLKQRLSNSVVELEATYAELMQRSAELQRQLNEYDLVLTTAIGQPLVVPMQHILAFWTPNAMSPSEKLSRYGSAVAEFLTQNPREANTEGGVFPAIFGTVLMVLLMSVVVTPFGVIAAIYLHEYASQQWLVNIVRVAVNNLAGVPSIVYGVFGLGFFVYFLGGNIDALFFADKLPGPTFGTPGLIWASLTLALLTVPTVIVSTEEGLARIPQSMREGSMALGATQAETLFKVILPIASPAILTGVILAIARAAGEVAPLMLVGVVKLAPTLPVDGTFPYLHLDRKFMHLGFHIYDVGFQSPNVEAARPLVYATSLLLVTIIVGLNLAAFTLRARLEKSFKGVIN